MAVSRHIGSEYPDLTVRDLALLNKPGFIDHQHCIGVSQMLNDIVADKIT